MLWDQRRIIGELRKLEKSGADLSYNALSRRRQALVSAAAYHFGSYRRAVEAAAIRYETVLRRPRWTKASIVALLKSAHRKRTELCWSSVTRRNDELGRAAFAALQPRLFGRWDKALAAAGIKADSVSKYHAWDEDRVVRELRALRGRDGALSSGHLQKKNAALHAAAVRHFGTYEQALAAAHIRPESVRMRKAWSREAAIEALKKEARKGKHLSDSSVRESNPALYGACVRIFGRFTAARSAARIAFDRRNGR